MKAINVDTIVSDIYGEPLQRPVKPGLPELVPATLAFILVESLGSKKPANVHETMQVYQLQKRILNGGDVKFTTEDIVKLKEAVHNFMDNPKQSGPVLEILEG